MLPFVIVLAISGALYLFKPQIERWEERDFQNQSTVASVAPHRQVQLALAAHPGARFLDYRLPDQTGDAAMVRLALPDDGTREVFVAPGGAVLGAVVPEQRVMAIVKRVHSELMVGSIGNRLVELTASWAIVLILSGLYLWWPGGDRGMAGVLWPRLTRGSRLFWRDLHAVTGIWISVLALVLLLTGLPWTEVWGNGFRTVRTELGWVKGNPPWAIDDRAQTPAIDPHGGHRDHDAHGPTLPFDGEEPFDPAVFDAMVTRARSEQFAFPAIVTPPGAPGRFGMPGEMVWSIRSDAANVPLQQTIRVDLAGRRELSRERFADNHVIDQVVGYGIAWHQGQLFGPFNQLIGVITALGLGTLAVSGFVMWRRRKPENRLGAPPIDARVRPGTAVAMLVALALFLPLLALSLLLILLIERIALPRLPRLAQWLGVNA